MGTKINKDAIKQYFTEEPEEAPDYEAIRAKLEAEVRAELEAGYRTNPDYVEKRTSRIQIVVQPSTAETLKALARREGISVNEAVNRAITSYIEKESDKK